MKGNHSYEENKFLWKEIDLYESQQEVGNLFNQGNMKLTDNNLRGQHLGSHVVFKKIKKIARK